MNGQQLLQALKDMSDEQLDEPVILCSQGEAELTSVEWFDGDEGATPAIVLEA